MAADRSHAGESHCHVTAGAAAVAGTAVAVCAVDRAHEGISGTYNHTQHSKSECARHTTCTDDDHASTMQCECVTASSSEELSQVQTRGSLRPCRGPKDGRPLMIGEREAWENSEVMYYCINVNICTLKMQAACSERSHHHCWHMLCQ